jgi:hypothetical protein
MKENKQNSYPSSLVHKDKLQFALLRGPFNDALKKIKKTWVNISWASVTPKL